MNRQLIAVAGPYSAADKPARHANFKRLQEAAREVLERGHIPVIGVNAALPIVEPLGGEERYDAVMRISLGIIERCDAILVIGSSPGADRERKLIEDSGKTVYTRSDDIPVATT